MGTKMTITIEDVTDEDYEILLHDILVGPNCDFIKVFKLRYNDANTNKVTIDVMKKDKYELDELNKLCDTIGNFIELNPW